MKNLEEVAITMGKLATFAYLNFATQTGNPEAGALLQEIREVASRIGKETLFFELEWNTLDTAIIERLLKDESLARYRHYLEIMRRYADHLR